MNGLLRHTGNIHRGMSKGRNLSYLGVVWNNIKAGFVFAYDTAIGLIKNIKLW